MQSLSLSLLSVEPLDLPTPNPPIRISRALLKFEKAGKNWLKIVFCCCSELGTFITQTALLMTS